MPYFLQPSITRTAEGVDLYEPYSASGGGGIVVSNVGFSGVGPVGTGVGSCSPTGTRLLSASFPTDVTHKYRITITTLPAGFNNNGGTVGSLQLYVQSASYGGGPNTNARFFICLPASILNSDNGFSAGTYSCLFKPTDANSRVFVEAVNTTQNVTVNFSPDAFVLEDLGVL